jgi:hypothetical protein
MDMLLLNHIHHSPRYGYVYVDTPKVACSTIKHTLQCAERGEASLSINGDGSAPGQYGYSEFLLRIHDRCKSLLEYPRDLDQLERILKSSCFVFCFVRNPFTRVLSAYLDKILGPAERRALFLEKLGIPGTENLGFVEFLGLVQRQMPEAMDPHWRPQHVHLHVLAYNFIGSFERFQQDFHTVLTTIDPTLQKYAVRVDEHGTNASSMALVGYHYADTRAVDLVSRIYERDFALFGYPAEIERSGSPPNAGGWG